MEMKPENMRLIKVDELSKILGRTMRTVRGQVTSAPHLLPPRFIADPEHPGAGGVVWLQHDAFAWLASRSNFPESTPLPAPAPAPAPIPANPAAKKRGRPLKSAQVQARERQAASAC